LKFDARAWKNTGAGLTFYVSQHRKADDVVVFITQHLSQVETRIRNITETFVECTNTENKRIFSLFRRRSKLVQEWRYKCPPAPVDRKIEEVLDKDLAKCYRTMGGYGVGGRKKPETKRIRGIPVYWLLLPVLAGVWLMTKAPEWIGAGVGKMVKNVSGQATKSEPKKDQTATVDTGQPLPAKEIKTEYTAMGAHATIKEENKLWVVGWVVFGNKYNVIMSNGEVWTESTEGMAVTDGASIERNGLYRNGVFYPIKPAVSRYLEKHSAGFGGGGEVRAAPPAADASGEKAL